MSTNEGWVFGPMTVGVATASAVALDPSATTSNADPPAITVSASAYDAYVARFGGEGTQSGYGPFYDSSEYPGALPNIWSEGTGVAALAFSRAGDHTRWINAHTWMDQMQELDGSLRYVEVDDADYGLFRLRSVMGAAWFVLAHLEGGVWGDPIGSICMRDII